MPQAAGSSAGHGADGTMRAGGKEWQSLSYSDRKVLYLHDAAELDDLRVPPGNRLEAMKGRWKGFHSIRINDQWRIVFRWEHGHAHDVAVIDYH